MHAALVSSSLSCTQASATHTLVHKAEDLVVAVQEHCGGTAGTAY